VHRTVFFCVCLALAGCASPQKPVEPYLGRDTYQKVTVTSYAGASSDPNEPLVTARGTRYRSGAISSAAADWSRWPAGTLFRVLATGDLYEVDDFTDDIVGRNAILLYRPPVARLPDPGSHYMTIEILRWGSPNASASMLKQNKSSTAKRILAELKARYPEIR